jgi:hypothetical protein
MVRKQRHVQGSTWKDQCSCTMKGWRTEVSTSRSARTYSPWSRARMRSCPEHQTLGQELIYGLDHAFEANIPACLVDMFSNSPCACLMHTQSTCHEHTAAQQHENTRCSSKPHGRGCGRALLPHLAHNLHRVDAPGVSLPHLKHLQ